MVNQPLKLLLVEDSPEDAELAVHELRREGYRLNTQRVATAAGLRAALETGGWDLVLTDHNLPGLDPREAQSLIHDADADLPIVILSGTIGEEATVEALRSGARDVVLKTNLSRLGLVVGRVLDDAASRRRNRQSEADLVENHARMSAILDSALDCIISIDDNGRIVDFNPAAELTFGYKREAVRGRPMASLLVPPSLRRRYLVIFRRLLAGDASAILGSRVELTGMRADGSEFPLELALTRTELAGSAFFTACLRDLTTLNAASDHQLRLEEQLRQAKKMEAIGSLASGVAHDFNNLLTVIGAVSSIMRADSPDARLRDQISQIDAATARGADLTRQLLAYSSQQVLRPVTTDLNTVVEETLSLLERLIDKRISVQVKTAQAPAMIVVDPGQLSQVILNLGINARDAMPDGGILTIKTGRAELDQNSAPQAGGIAPGRYVLLEISDTGVGMDAETQSHIFDPYYTTKTEGTGLGLSTVHGIVMQSNGHISITSQPGAGTTITIHFPTATGPASPHPSPPKIKTLQGTETILVVEDADILRPLVVEILDWYGYTVMAAASGAEALAISERNPIDLLLTDIRMPGMDGRELAETLLERYPSLKVLFTSGHPAGANEAETGSVAFIQKPYLEAELARDIRILLDAPSEQAPTPTASPATATSSRY